MSDEKLIIYQVFTRLFGNNNNHCINNGSITGGFYRQGIRRNQKAGCYPYLVYRHY